MLRVAFVAVSQAHQFLHWIPAALELARRDGVRVEVLGGSRASLNFVRSYDRDGLLNIIHLPTPTIRRDTLFSPPKRRLTLRLHWRKFQRNDLIVTTESTTEFLKLNTPFDKPMVRMRHGAGDRFGGYRQKISSFDGVIVNGEKDKQRLIKYGIMPPDQIAVCGYCKFEAISAPYDPFADGKPLAIYNPHFDPTVSSWYGHQREILDAMAAVPDWNFVVAPHIKVTKGRRLMPSPASNIIIDPGSVHSIDMGYVEASKVYIGDASSQVYEFVRRPRPCIFLNPNHHEWRGDDHFRHWNFGQVIADMGEIGPALSRCRELQPSFEAAQIAALEDSLDPSPVPASVRHADALLKFARTGSFA